MLEVKDIYKTFNAGTVNEKKALRGLSLKLNEGDFVTVIGGNGMATLQKPKLLLLDEHTAALDPKTAAKVLELSAQLVQEGRLTTLMITHNMKDAIKYGNRLVMMHEGEIIYDVQGEEKAKLHVADLLEKFETVNSGGFANDRMLLN